MNVLLILLALAAPDGGAAPVPQPAAPTAAKPAAAKPAAEKASYASANRAYLSGNYITAAEEYEALVTSGIAHEDLYYNLGNAYFRMNKLGYAVYNYERALRLTPDFEDAEYNLGVTHDVIASRVVDRLRGAETDPLWIRAVTLMTVPEILVAFLIANLVFFSLLIVLRFLPFGLARTALMVGNGFVAVALLLSVILLGGRAYYIDQVPVGIILADKVWMREAPDEDVAGRGELHPGLRVRILARDPSWFRIRLSNGVEGWVPRSDLGQL